MDDAAVHPSRDDDHGRRPDLRTVLPGLIGVALCGLLALVNDLRDFALWRNYAVAGVFLGSALSWLLWQKDVRVPHYIQWMIVIAVMLHFGGGSTGSPVPGGKGLLGMRGINGTYHVFPWWDNVTHIAGTLAATLGFVYLLEAYQLRNGLGWRGRDVAVIAWLCGLALGVSVELYEYLGKTLFQTIDQGGYYNTMGDLVSNFVGVTTGAVIGVAVNRRWSWDRIQAQWGTQRPPQDGLPQTPAPIVGIIGFVTPAAVTALFLGARFLVQHTPPETELAYDRALLVLTRTAVIGAVLGPVASMGVTEWKRWQAKAEVRRAKDATPAPSSESSDASHRPTGVRAEEARGKAQPVPVGDD